MAKLEELRKEIKKREDPKQAKLLSGFFKTGKGEYGEGDIFLGIKVPVQRELVKEYWNIIDLEEAEELLQSKIHEERLIALLIFVKIFEKNQEERQKIFDFYMKNYNNINNWDLVDLSAPNIPGRWLFDKKDEREILYEFANSQHLWKKRIAVLATFYFIKNNDFEDSLKIAEILMKDSHDLIHKAVGWMLREIGKRNLDEEEKFLRKNNNYKNMPRTMLRYAIEKFDEQKRKFYLKK